MIERILVGTMAGDESGATVRLAADLATTHGAELVVLQLESMIDARDVFDPAGAPKQPNRTGRLRADYPGLRVRTSAAKGHPMRTVCDVAQRERADLIVVGYGRSRHNTALLTRRASSALVDQAPCAVLLVAS